MEKTETTTIEHDQWGRVEGVGKAWSPRDLSHWMKEENGRKTIFNESKGWREVKPTRWVPVRMEITRDGRTLQAWINDPKTYPMNFNLDRDMGRYRWREDGRGGFLIEKEVGY